ncbi:MAG TPA: uracil-DNA glycosylase family protein, partial [Gemmatimonadales bacterium]|nr:uracil-DNA glycosylase family protein [Gemmatimonadales bacterium]
MTKAGPRHPLLPKQRVVWPGARGFTPTHAGVTTPHVERRRAPAGEIEACRPWLRAEVEAVEPQGLLAMGATAARSLFGTKVKVTKDRSRPL